jgi:O-acetyl-ADP-ribose deacetylase (regulator of RNase III)
MSTVFVRGDLFAERDLSALGHGCNCAGAMGKGVAAEFRKRFPSMYEEYRRRCRDGRFALGDVFVWHEGGITIFNLGTQQTWRVKAELSAIRKTVAHMVELAAAAGLQRIGLPRIGAGLGGLVWDDVKVVLVEVGQSTKIELRIFEEYVPAGQP